MTANPLSTIPPIGPTTGVASAPAASRFKPIDPVRLLRQNFPYLIVAGVIGVVLGGAAWFVARKYNPQYASEATLIAYGIPDESKDNVVGGAKSSEIPEIEVFIRNQIAYLTSEDMLRRAIQWPTVQNSDWFQQFKGDIREAAKALEEDHLDVRPVRESTFFTLTMTMGTPNEAQEILNALITVYLRDRSLNQENDYALLNSVQQGELERYETEVNDLQEKMADFIKNHNLTTVEAQHTEESIRFQQLNQQKVLLGMELNAALGSIQGILQANEEDPNRAMSEGEEQQLRMLPGVAQREEQIRQLNEIIRTNMEMGIGEEHRSIRQLNQQIASVQTELDGLMTIELGKLRAAQVAQAMQMAEGIQAQLEKLEADTAEANARMQGMTNTLQRWKALEEQLDIARMRHADALQAVAELRTHYRRPDASRVGRHKNPREAELTSPLAYVWIPGVTLLCVGLTAGVIFLRELMDQRVKSPADVKMLPDATLLGLLPSAAEDPSGPTDVARIVQAAPTGLMAESYRQVRTSVLSRMDRRGYKTLVVVSAQPEAGTSSVAQNLAASLAYNGRNVLIVDANFRRPSQHKLADLRNDRGLVDVLQDRADAGDVIHREGDLSLSVMPTGRGSEAPPELLEGPAFRSLLGRLEAEYDIVIIDAPPALLTSESQLLAKHVDAIAVVVHAGQDKRGMVERMLGKLDGQRADVLGVILNGVRTSAGGYFRKSYEDFYNYREDTGPATNGRNGKKADKAETASDRATTDADSADADDIAEVLLGEDDRDRDA